MYSAVLIAALATTTATPSFGHRHRCCSTYSYESCHGCSGCTGCAAGGYRAYGHGYLAPWTSAYVYGGVQPYIGVGYGIHAGLQPHAVVGQGIVVADPRVGGWYIGCTGCYGCYGGHAGYGIPVPVVPVAPPAVRPKVDPFPPINPEQPQKEEKGAEEVAPLKEKGAPKVEKPNVDKPEEKKPKVEPKKTSIEEGVKIRAKVRIEVPQSSKLFVDGSHVRVAPGLRTFQTPPLAMGETYFYDIRLEVEAAGEVHTAESRVIIQPGQDIAVNFQSLQSGAVQSAQAR